MKKSLFTLAALLIGMTAAAQTFEESQRIWEQWQPSFTADGGYERKTVVEAEPLPIAEIFPVVMERLSDWTGPVGRVRSGIDYCDKEAGIIIYKGSFSLGFKNIVLGQGYERWADFTMKVRMKPGRAQITINIPLICARDTRDNDIFTEPVKKVVRQVMNSTGSKRRRGDDMLNTLTSSVDAMIASVSDAMNNPTDNDF